MKPRLAVGVESRRAIFPLLYPEVLEERRIGGKTGLAA